MLLCYNRQPHTTVQMIFSKSNRKIAGSTAVLCGSKFFLMYLTVQDRGCSPNLTKAAISSFRYFAIWGYLIIWFNFFLLFIIINSIFWSNVRSDMSTFFTSFLLLFRDADSSHRLDDLPLDITWLDTWSPDWLVFILCLQFIFLLLFFFFFCPAVRIFLRWWGGNISLLKGH